MPTAMKLAKSRAMPALRQKQGRRWLVVTSTAIGLTALCLAAFFLFYPGSISLNAEEAELAELINQTRRNNNIQGVQVNPALCEMARRYSQWMCENQTTQLPTVGQMEQQLDSVGYAWADWGMLTDRLYNRGPKFAFVSWMQNEQHRGELKSIHHDDVGISVVQDPKQPEVYYVTVVFGKKKS